VDWQGPFTGNGWLGTVVYFCDPPPNGHGRGGFCQIGNATGKAEMRIELGRQDLYSARVPHANYWNGVRLPVGYLRLPLAGTLRSGLLRLNLYTAELTGHLVTSVGRVEVRLATLATSNMHLLEINGTGGEAHDAATPAVSPFVFVPLTRCVDRWDVQGLINCTMHPYPAATCEAESSGEYVCHQSLNAAEGSFATAVLQQTDAVGGGRKVYMTTESNLWPFDTATDPRPVALAAVRQAATAGCYALLAPHREWWREYWGQTFFSFTNTDDDMRTESFYNVELYRLGSSMREDGPVRDEIGPW